MPKVGIVLVNFTGYAQRFLEECRDSLRAQTFPSDQFQVYIVDNVSSVESRSFIQKVYPEALCLPRADGNYTAANNFGMKRAIADGCELVVDLNMDTRATPEWLAELVKAVESDARWGLAQSKLLLYPRDEADEKAPRINGVGNIFNFLGFGFTDGYGQRESECSVQEIQEITGYGSGCALIIKKEVLQAIDFFNEEYYMYHEDLELGWRAKLAGYKVALASRARIFHKYEFSRSVRMLYYMERNRYLTLFSFYRWPTLLLIAPALVVMELAMWSYALAKGWSRVKARAFGYFFKFSTWKKIFKVRRQIKKIRKIKDREMVKNFSGRVDFQEIENPLLKYVGNPLMNIYWQVAKRLIFW